EGRPELADPHRGAAVREIHERVPDAELRLLVSERRITVERSEEIGLERRSRCPLPERWRSVESEVDAGVPDVDIEDPLIDAGLEDLGLTSDRNTRGCNLGILPLHEGAEQPAGVEESHVDEPADRERLSFPQLDHLLR